MKVKKKLCIILLFIITLLIAIEKNSYAESITGKTYSNYADHVQYAPFPLYQFNGDTNDDLGDYVYCRDKNLHGPFIAETGGATFKMVKKQNMSEVTAYILSRDYFRGNPKRKQRLVSYLTKKRVNTLNKNNLSNSKSKLNQLSINGKYDSTIESKVNQYINDYKNMVEERKRNNNAHVEIGQVKDTDVEYGLSKTIVADRNWNTNTRQFETVDRNPNANKNNLILFEMEVESSFNDVRVEAYKESKSDENKLKVYRIKSGTSGTEIYREKVDGHDAMRVKTPDDNGNKFKILIDGNQIPDDTKKIVFYAYGGTTSDTIRKYTGTIKKYEHKGTKSVQRLIRFRVDHENEPVTADDHCSVGITHEEPKIIVVKYVKKITDSEGNTKWEADSWDEKAKVTVDTDKGVNESGRYSVSEQPILKDANGKPVYVHNGDIIRYVFRIYNVGNKEINSEDDKLNAENKNYLQDDILYDTPCEYLDFVDGIEETLHEEDDDGNDIEITYNKYEWEKTGNKYKLDMSEHYESIDPPENNRGDTEYCDEWSTYVEIRFKVNVPADKQKENVKIDNNDTIGIPHGEPAVVATKYIQEVWSKNNDLKYKSDSNFSTASWPDKPEVTVDETKGVLQAGRYDIKPQDPNELIDQTTGGKLEIENGDRIKFVFRVYNIGNCDIYQDEAKKEKLTALNDNTILKDNILYDSPGEGLDLISDPYYTWKLVDPSNPNDKRYKLDFSEFMPSHTINGNDEYVLKACNGNKTFENTGNWSGYVVIEFKVNITEEHARKAKEGLKIKNNNLEFNEPNIAVTKYVQEVTSNGITKYKAPDSWKQSDWSVSNEKPIARVDRSKDILSSDRVNIQKAGTDHVKLKNGDVITYALRVYNICEDTIDFDQYKYNSEIADEEGNRYIKNNYVYDIPVTPSSQLGSGGVDYSKYLEIQNDDPSYIWEQVGTKRKYKLKLTGKVNATNNDDPEKTDEWSKVVFIKFKLNMPDDVYNGLTEEVKVYNNGVSVKVPVDKVIVTKYIKSIKHKNGTEINIPDRPVVTIDLTKKVNEDGRYDITPQNTSKLNISNEDTITYAFRVYNVGDREVELSDTSLQSSDNNDWLVNNWLYDTPGANLTYVDGGWIQSGSQYKIKISGKINKTDGNMSNVDNWSMEKEIKFKFTMPDNDKFEITNNGDGVKVPARPEAVKFLYSVTDTEGNETTFSGPTATVDATKPVMDADRIKFTEHAVDPTIMNGYTLKYCIRFYSIGDNSIELTTSKNDTFSEGLVYQGVENGTVTGISIGDEGPKTATVTPDDVILEKYGLTTKEGSATGIQNGIQYYDVYVTFNVKLEDEIDKKPSLKNEISDKPGGDIVPTGYEIKGKVFIDLNPDGKWTGARDNLLGSNDIVVDGITVELLNENGSIVCDEYDSNNIPCIKDPATGKLYPTKVETDSNGEYTFTHLRTYQFKIHSDKTVTNMDTGVEITDFYGLSNAEIVQKVNSKPYRVRFSYNGQEYEDIEYNQDNYAGNGSYATEEDRGGFDNKFTKIDSTNSAELSLKIPDQKSIQGSDIANEWLEKEKGTVRDIRNVTQPTTNPFMIQAYTGSNGKSSTKDQGGLINVQTKHKEHVNLGVSRRHFDLELKNDLKDMDITINGTKEKETSINGHIIEKDLLDEEVYFRKEDYIYGKNQNVNEPLDVWVNYEVEISNHSRDAFDGYVEKIKYFYENRFGNDLKIDGVPTNCGGEQNGLKVIEIPVNKKIEKGKPVTIKISLHLTRETIENAIENSSEFKSLFTVAEILDYKTYYEGTNTNAGKIDEDSNAGSVKTDEYMNIENIKTTTSKEVLEKVKKILEYLEDDGSRAVGIILRRAEYDRKISGYVFEDITEVKSTKERLGDGKKDDIVINDVEVELIDGNNNLRYKGKTENGGVYTISQFPAGSNYILKFTYGDGKTKYYNAQDYKSTIDTFNIPTVWSKGYSLPSFDGEGFANSGEDEYWYSKCSEYSVAKDEKTKMSKENYNFTGNNEGKLTNASAVYLEEKADSEVYGNTARTEQMYIPITKYAEPRLTENTDNYKLGYVNLGLAERPRSELTIHKEVDRVVVTASDGKTIVSGTQNNPGANLSWVKGYYVQPIVDESLIYGSTITITYKMWIENTGEVDYMSSGNIGVTERRYYDYGGISDVSEKVTTKATKVIDYIDENLLYDKNSKFYNSTNPAETNEKYWGDKINGVVSIDDRIDDKIKNDVKKWSTKVVTTNENPLVQRELTPGDNTKDSYAYITVSKVMSSAKEEELLTYNNYVEIIESENTAGRRSYTSKDADFNTNTNELLSEMKNNRGIPDPNINPFDTGGEKHKDEYVLSIPGNLNPTNLYTLLEPDATQAEEIQVIPPFGVDQKTIIMWTTIGIVAIGLLGAGIYLIKKYTLDK